MRVVMLSKAPDEGMRDARCPVMGWHSIRDAKMSALVGSADMPRLCIVGEGLL